MPVQLFFSLSFGKAANVNKIHVPQVQLGSSVKEKCPWKLLGRAAWPDQWWYYDTRYAFIAPKKYSPQCFCDNSVAILSQCIERKHCTALYRVKLGNTYRLYFTPKVYDRILVSTVPPILLKQWALSQVAVKPLWYNPYLKVSLFSFVAAATSNHFTRAGCHCSGMLIMISYYKHLMISLQQSAVRHFSSGKYFWETWRRPKLTLLEEHYFTFMVHVTT